MMISYFAERHTDPVFGAIWHQMITIWEAGSWSEVGRVVISEFCRTQQVLRSDPRLMQRCIARVQYSTVLVLVRITSVPGTVPYLKCPKLKQTGESAICVWDDTKQSSKNVHETTEKDVLVHGKKAYEITSSDYHPVYYRNVQIFSRIFTEMTQIAGIANGVTATILKLYS